MMIDGGQIEELALRAIDSFLEERQRLHSVVEHLTDKQRLGLARRLDINVVTARNWDEETIAAYRDWYLNSKDPYITGEKDPEKLTPYGLYYWCGQSCANLFEQRRVRALVTPSRIPRDDGYQLAQDD